MNGYYESDEHVNWRWQRRCKIAEEIAAAKQAAQLSNIQTPSTVAVAAQKDT